MQRTDEPGGYGMVRRFLRSLSHTAVGRLLAPAWFDEARFIIQERALDCALRPHQLNGRVLNAGCGEGLYSPYIERFAAVTSIVNMDYARPGVAIRRSDGRHRDTQGSLTALPFTSGAFDAVVCTEVLEHVPDDRAAVNELARVLKPSGLIILSVPMPPAPHDPAHVREGYSADQLRALFHSFGLIVISSAVCLHFVSRVIYRVWRMQREIAGHNVFPRAALRAAARLDAITRWGRPWDLVVVAIRRPDLSA